MEQLRRVKQEDNSKSKPVRRFPIPSSLIPAVLAGLLYIIILSITLSQGVVDQLSDYFVTVTETCTGHDEVSLGARDCGFI
jgi:hypothetical protein